MFFFFSPNVRYQQYLPPELSLHHQKRPDRSGQGHVHIRHDEKTSESVDNS
jgi:hypothetical protein